MKKLLIYILTVFSWLMTGCNFNQVDRTKHDEAVQTELKTFSVDNSKDEKKENFELTAKDIYEKMNAHEHFQVVARCRQLMTDPKSFEFLSITNKQLGVTVLGYYNFSLMELVRTNKQGEELNHYKKWLLQGCNAKLQNCETISLLRRDPRSVLLVLEIIKIASTSPDLDEYYKLIEVGKQVHGWVANPALETAYLQRGQEYFDYLEQQGSKRQSDLDRHIRIFQMSLGNFTFSSKDKSMKPWLAKINAWKYSKSERSSAALGSIKLFSAMAKNYMYDKGNLDKNLSESLLALKSAKDQLGDSFDTSLKLMLKDSAKTKAMKKLGIDFQFALSSEFYNEYFYVIDRLYRGHLDLEDANVFWDGSKKEEENFSKILQTYVRIEFIKMVFNTSEYVVQVFQKNDIPNEKLFEEVINKSQPTTEDWAQLLSRFQNIYNFVKPKSHGNGSKLIKDATFLNSFNKTIKYFAINPNMFAIGNIMIDLEAEVTVKSFWGILFKVNPKEIMQQLIDGAIDKPWFIFGGDSSPLNKTDLMMSFYFGVQAGLFDFFKNVKDANSAPRVTEAKFFASAIRRTLSEDTSKISRAIEQLEDYAQNRVTSFEKAGEFCKPLQDKNTNFTLQFDTVDLAKWSLFGTADDFLIKDLREFYSKGPLATFSEVRNVYESRLIQIKSMMEIIEKTQDGGDESRKLSAEIKKEVAQYDLIKKKFFVAAIQQHRRVSTCLNEMMLMERERSLDFYENEIKFFSTVYDEKVKTTNEKGLYVYTELDLLNRLKAYSSKLKPSIVFNDPTDTDKAQLGLKLYVVPFVDIATSRLFSKEEFVSYALRGLASTELKKYDWLRMTGEMSPLTAKLESMLALYNMRFDLDQIGPRADHISPGEILKHAAFQLKYIGISEREAKILRILGQRSRETKDKMLKVLFKVPDSEFIGILDSSLDKWLQTDTDLKEGLDFYSAKINLGGLSFETPDSIWKIVESKYKKKIISLDRKVDEIIKSLENFKQEVPEQSLTITYELSETGGKYSPTLIKDGHYGVISKNLVDKLKGVMQNFHKAQTNGEFKK